MTHRNPECGICLTRVKLNDKYLTCSCCLQLTHKKCLDNFSDEDFNYALDKQTHWSCTSCNLHLFPFTQIDDEIEFAMAISYNRHN